MLGRLLFLSANVLYLSAHSCARMFAFHSLELLRQVQSAPGLPHSAAWLRLRLLDLCDSVHDVCPRLLVLRSLVQVVRLSVPELPGAVRDVRSMFKLRRAWLYKLRLCPALLGQQLLRSSSLQVLHHELRHQRLLHAPVLRQFPPRHYRLLRTFVRQLRQLRQWLLPELDRCPGAGKRRPRAAPGHGARSHAVFHHSLQPREACAARADCQSVRRTPAGQRTPRQ